MSGLLLATAYTALLLFAARRMALFRRVPGISGHGLVALFGMKLLAGAALWAVYTHVYPDRHTADIFKYFDDSAVMHAALWERPLDFVRMLTGVGNDSPYFTERYYLVMNNWVRQYENNVYNDSHTMIRLNAVLRILSAGHYAVHTVFACAFSMVGLVALHRALDPWAQSLERGLAGAVFLWPSVLFWPSAPLKESLLMLGLGLFLLGVLHPSGRSRGPVVLAALIGLAVMLVVKFYVLFCLVPGVLALLLQRWRGGGILRYAIATHLGALILVMVSGTLFPGYDVLELFRVKQKDFIGMAMGVGSGSLVEMPLLGEGVWGFVRNAPHALYMTFLSPFEAADRGAVGLAGALENAVVLLLPLLALWWRKPWQQVDQAALLFTCSFVLLLALVIGWTVPVVGALVRYRVPLLPFVGLLALLLVDARRLPTFVVRLLRAP
ncbi:MAG: hypothetical protein IPJ87_09715 [Flavobacteriales bacterium]|jgi:hypothetical protein|nr:hypothetical protein [Flavobacteriales bacterium]MBK7942129.1 hypothetical protein [Flavobacteriales bacterium]MBK8949606.1 hypothetical protein [Flavobacteriales bacterium]MBK9700670.1 hypothetical protein [Flavobacteriales bacterium]